MVREAVGESGRTRLARVRATAQAVRPGPSLAERIGPATRHGGPGLDLFEQAGWSELLEEAAGGQTAFEGGALRMSLAPAMTLFDVDRALRPPSSPSPEPGRPCAFR